uniref:uncharacterized protein LOC113475603 n=1 Tax=Ciona intestinalis TaxID=7719 RepID=UPI000EF4460A|nr:uncharacterized protein LOC113475603 [Ciona intestinalis]|eukprot:XP_026695744.1 uncharacterized protein LOC113475603 [Ciona intestinalis]
MPSCVARLLQQQHKKKRLFRFSNTDPLRRNKWIVACKRKAKDGSDWNPTSKHTYICEDHFITGQPSLEECHPDFVPSVFNFRQMSEIEKKTKLDRYQRMSSRTTDITTTTKSETSIPAVDQPKTNDNDVDLENDKEVEAVQLNRLLLDEVGSLRSETKKLKQEIQNLRSKQFSYEMFRNDADKFKFYTGITCDVFDYIFNFISCNHVIWGYVNLLSQ